MVGDRFSVDSAEVVGTQPRLPCYRLVIKFELDDMVKRFLTSRRTGFYVTVAPEGDVRTGDDLTLLNHDRDSVPVSQITRLYVAKGYDPDSASQVHRAIAAIALHDNWKTYFEEKLDRLDG